jgi:acyl carrier protein
MGLDAVELLLATEEEFGIHIDSADAAELATPAMLANHIESRVRSVGDKSCPSQVGFYRIRTALVKSFGANRRDVLPDSPIRAYLTGNVRTQWRQLQVAVGAKEFPVLKRNLAILVATFGAFPTICAFPLLIAGFPPVLAAMAFCLACLAANYATYGMGSVIPPKYASVGSLIPFVTCDSSVQWTSELILERVIQLTSDQLGIPVEQIQSDAHFVRDLGLD